MSGRVLAAAVVLLSACGLSQDLRPAQYAELKKRAAFDLRCEETQLKVVPIHEDIVDYGCAGQHHVDSARTAGVTCNESRATYERLESRWIMNNDGNSAAKK